MVVTSAVQAVPGLNAFCRAAGLLKGSPFFDQIVATAFTRLWTTANS
jgi:hypothetical protein